MMHRHAEDEAAAKARYKKMKADVIKTNSILPGIFTMVGRGVAAVGEAIGNAASAVGNWFARGWRSLFG